MQLFILCAEIVMLPKAIQAFSEEDKELNIIVKHDQMIELACRPYPFTVDDSGIFE